jgi:hypothetical protein
VYCFVENTDSIGEAFGEALGGLLSVTHQNVRLCLELAPGVTLVKARTTYQVSAPTQGDDGWQSVSIDVGDLYAEERRDIPIELSLPEATSDEPNTIGRLHARGFSVGDSRSETTGQTDLAVERLEDAPTDFGHAHPQVQRHRNRYSASEALEQARAAARRGELEAARKLVSDAIKELQGSSLAVAGCQFTATLLADLEDCRKDMENDFTYSTTGSKKLAMFSRSHQTQRTCGGVTSLTYGTSRSKGMKALSKMSIS